MMMNRPPLLDDQCVTTMRRLKLLDRLYPAFIADLPQRLAALRAAITAVDRPEIRQIAHRLRGSAAQLGAAALARALREIEEAAIDEASGLELADAGLEELARATVAALQRELSANSR